MGLGLIQVPRYRVSSELASGALVEVLAGFPPSPLPVHVLYSHGGGNLERLFTAMIY
jgi:DNA-binding transcriptional LysR family regulator